MGTLNLIFFETVVWDPRWGSCTYTKGAAEKQSGEGFLNTQRTKQLKLECAISLRYPLAGFILIASDDLTVYLVLVISHAFMLDNANEHCLKCFGFRSEITVWVTVLLQKQRLSLFFYCHYSVWIKLVDLRSVWCYYVWCFFFFKLLFELLTTVS